MVSFRYYFLDLKFRIVVLVLDPKQPVGKKPTEINMVKKGCPETGTAFILFSISNN